MFKEMGTCTFCKKRYEFIKEQWREKRWPKSYCSECCAKYFNKSKKEE